MRELHKNDDHASRQEDLALVRALSQQITSAISAIECNNLEQLRASVASQEILCQEIARTSVRCAATDENLGMSKEIRDTHIGLAKLNRQYAALLKRAHRSCNLMVMVYRNYGRNYSQGDAQRGSAASEPHTWSCEG
jgi:hypothetical protein